MNNAFRNKKCRTSLAALAALGAVSLGLSQTALAAPVTRIFTVEVSAAHNHAFREAVIAWHKCERANGMNSTVLVYDAETGDLSRYAFLNVNHSWAEMDQKNPAAKACGALFRDGVLPNIQGASSEIMQENPKITHLTGSEPDPFPLAWVDAFRLKPGQSRAFHAALKEFAAAAAKSHWEGQFEGDDVMGSGEGGEDFILVWPNKNWADAGMQAKPSARQMMNSVYGKSKAKSIYKHFTDTIADDWSDVWSYDKELSLPAQK